MASRRNTGGSGRSGRNDIAKYLKIANKSWDDAQKQAESFGKGVDEGSHIAELCALEVGLAKEKLVVRPRFEVLEGDSAGGKVNHETLWLHTPGSQSWFAAWCDRIDIEPPESLNDVQEWAKAAMKKQVVCKIKVFFKDPDDDYPECKVRARVHDYEPGEPADDQGTPDDGLGGLTRKELKAIILDEELDVALKSSWSEEDIVEGIREARKDVGGGGNDDTGETVNLDKLAPRELRQLIKKDKLDIPGAGRMDKEALIDAIQNVDGDAGGGTGNEGAIEINEETFEDFCANQEIKPKAADKKNKTAMKKYLQGFDFPQGDLKDLEDRKGKVLVEDFDRKFLEEMGLENLITEE